MSDAIKPAEVAERLEAALLALEPFAMAANCLFERDSDGIIFGLVHAPLGMPVPLNYGHLRKAKAAYDAALERK